MEKPFYASFRWLCNGLRDAAHQPSTPENRNNPINRYRLPDRATDTSDRTIRVRSPRAAAVCVFGLPENTPTTNAGATPAGRKNDFSSRKLPCEQETSDAENLTRHGTHRFANDCRRLTVWLVQPAVEPSEEVFWCCISGWIGWPCGNICRCPGDDHARLLGLWCRRNMACRCFLRTPWPGQRSRHTTLPMSFRHSM